MLFLIPTVVSLDCFKLSSMASYSVQRSIVRFSATPSNKLVGEEKRLCEDVIDGQQYELQVHLGDVVFSQTGLTYNKKHRIDVNVPCMKGQSCEFANVQNVQTATYRLIFIEIDFMLSSIVNFYQLRRYNHLSCIQTANLIYDGIQKTMEVQVVDPVDMCPCKLISAQNIQPPITKNNSNVFITSRMGGATLGTNAYSDKNKYSGLLTFNNSGQNLTVPSTNDMFWTELIKFGPYNQQNLPTIPLLLTAIQNKPVLDLSMRVQLLTVIKQNRDNTSLTPAGKDSFYYNQSIEYSIAQLTNKNQGDCFTGVDAQLHKTFFFINTAQNASAQQCSKEHITNKSGKDYDSIRIQIIASQNLDKTGFNYYAEYNLTEFEIGQDLSRRFYCQTKDDCSNFTEISRLQHLNNNMSVSVKLLFVNKDTITFAITYVTNFSLTNYNKTFVSVFGTKICLDMTPHETGSQVIEFSMFEYVFDMSQYIMTGQRIYCSDIQRSQQAAIYSIITQMKSREDVLQSIRLDVGDEIVGDLNVIIYEIPQSNKLCWAFCGVLTILGCLGCVCIQFMLQIQVDVWAADHAASQLK